MRAHGEISGCELAGCHGAFTVTFFSGGRCHQAGHHHRLFRGEFVRADVIGFSLLGLSEGNLDMRVGTWHQPGMARGLHCCIIAQTA